MANTRTYLNHLLQSTGITPACSEEERVAAEEIAQIFAHHGFTPETQEFSASGSQRMVQGVLGIAAFLGAVLMGVGGAIGVVGLLLALAAAVLYALERSGRPILSSLGAGGLSQNVIAYHKASGPLASPRNRPVVIVAHYDSPRADIFANMPYAAYRPALVKLLPIAMLVPAIVAIVRLLPLPGAASTLLWIVAILVALVPLAQSVAIILNRFVLPYTSGAVCNKSSVASLLGVMDAVAPYEGVDEFPGDVPFEEYFEEQQCIAEEERAAAEAAANPDYADLLEQEGIVVEEEAAAEDEAASENEAVEADDFAADDEEESAAEVADEELESEDFSFADEVAEDTASSDDDGALAVEEAISEVEQEATEEAAEPEQPSIINAAGMYRFGADAIHALGMVPESCVLVYEDLDPAPQHAARPAAAVPASTPSVAAPQEESAFAAPAEEVEETSEFAAQQDMVEKDVSASATPLDDDFEDEDDGRDYEAERDALISSTHKPIRHQPIQQVNAPARGFTGLSGIGGAGGIGELFSQVGGKASELFSSVLHHGRHAIESIESTARSITGSNKTEDELYESYDENAAEDLDGTEGAFDDEGQVGENVSWDEAGEDSWDEEVASDTFQDDAQDDGGAAADEVPMTGATQVFAALDDEDQHTATIEDTIAVDASTIAPAFAEDDGQLSTDMDDDAFAPEAGAPAVDETVSASEDVDVTGDTQLFVMPEPEEEAAASEVVAASTDEEARPEPVAPQPSAPVETVDSLMAEISSAHPRRTAFNTVPDPAQPSLNQNSPSSRASLFDLPDPSVASDDPFATSAPRTQNVSTTTSFEVVDGTATWERQQDDSPFETITTDDASAAPAQRGKRGFGKLFGRKKHTDVTPTDAWDDFDGDDWKGGATGIQGVSEHELRDAITSMGDDELLGHDIWFVATGASEYGNAGMKAFLETHRDKLRGVFLINLECVGAGQLAMVATEGDRRVLKGDKRITNLVRRVSAAFHNEFVSVEMPYEATDAYVAMNMSLRSLTIAGVDGPNFACSHSEADQPYNVNPENVDLVADVVTEVIRRS